MALNLLDFKDEALKGFDAYIFARARWFLVFRIKAKITNLNKETNFCAYISSGALHHFLNFKTKFFRKIWPTLKKSIEFVISVKLMETFCGQRTTTKSGWMILC